MAKILNEEELEKLCNDFKNDSKETLVKNLTKAAKELNELRKLKEKEKNILENENSLKELNELRKLKEKEKSILEKENSLQDREALIKKEEENVSVLKQKYVNDEANANSKMLELKIQEESLKKEKSSLDKLLNEVSNEKAKIINEFTKRAEESYALRSQSIENEIKTKRTKAQEEYDSIIKQANEIASKIRKDAQDENENINNLKNIKTKLEQENTELKSKVDMTNSLIEEKAELTKKNVDLESKLKTIEATNVSLSERTKNFEEYETLDRTLQSAELSISSVIESIKNLEKEKQNLQNEKIKFEKEKQSLEQEKKRLSNREDAFSERERNLETEIKAQVEKENQRQSLELTNLRIQLEETKKIFREQQTESTLIENLERKLGENPKETLKKIKEFNENMINSLEEATEPPYAIKRRIAELNQQKAEVEEKENELDRRLEETKQVRKELNLVKAENANLKEQCQNQERDNIIIKGELERLRSTYSNPQGQQEREAQINIPCEGFENKPDKLSKDEYPKSENEWLQNIKDKIKQSGFIFPDRIVDAFHTALKTAEISPLTVLAGVSGTGKSKLPEYYARFGGINFLSVPVQPNWDCQESMTGFYNSIDNCFEPTQILRLLAQSQRNPNDQNGLNDVMTMILLDEMNLANIELYFAEFLSKLETRRGHYDEQDIPSVWIKLGASKGIKKWPLKLGRNVLWTGTMNQDETTKTLSDKVLDRGIVINFPRPEKFEPLPRTKLIDAQPLLPREIWEEWVRNKFDFSKNETLNKKLKEKKECIENINRELGRAGRALGHRVWQSIELYMSLYPGVVLAQDDSARQVAMENAFEDQIVQKIMPKLRGIETRGIQGEVLNNIKGYIPETLHDDYKNAQEQGYGQFMWTSSGYILRESKVLDESANSTITNTEENIVEEKSNDSVTVAEEKHITEKPKKNNNDTDIDSDSVIEEVCEGIKSGKIKKSDKAIIKHIMDLGFNQSKAVSMCLTITKKLKKNN